MIKLSEEHDVAFMRLALAQGRRVLPGCLHYPSVGCVDELGDASVPFWSDVHAMDFSDNAPALEAKLHCRLNARTESSLIYKALGDRFWPEADPQQAGQTRSSQDQAN